jgi:hypothetical protein
VNVLGVSLVIDWFLVRVSFGRRQRWYRKEDFVNGFRDVVFSRLRDGDSFYGGRCVVGGQADYVIMIGYRGLGDVVPRLEWLKAMVDGTGGRNCRVSRLGFADGQLDGILMIDGMGDVFGSRPRAVEAGDMYGWREREKVKGYGRSEDDHGRFVGRVRRLVRFLSVRGK